MLRSLQLFDTKLFQISSSVPKREKEITDKEKGTIKEHIHFEAQGKKFPRESALKELTVY